MSKYKVYLGSCPHYKTNQLQSVINKGMNHIELNQPIIGHVVIKPNLVMAHPVIAPSGFTRSEVVEGLLKILRDQFKDIQQIDIVEKSGLGVTTAKMFKNAGYNRLKKKYNIRLRAMEENPQVRVKLTNGKVHQSVNVAREMLQKDFLIFMPKLKSNVLSHGLSAALKLNIGTIDSKERLHRHHYDLPAKIVDLLEIANPDLIVTDGIRMAYGGNQMTQHGKDLGLIAISNNAVAHDIVCAHCLNLDPMKIDHIKEAVDRGFGPASLKEIEILGDYPIHKAQSIVSEIDLGFLPVDQVQSPMHVYSGTPYCVGGCHGIFLDWIYMIKDRKPKLFKKLPALNIVIGKVEENIKKGQIVFIGNCAKQSNLSSGGRKVWIKGCPPSHKRIVWDMLVNFLIFNPLVRVELVIDAYLMYPIKKVKGWLLNLNRPTMQRGERIYEQV